jgi:RND family efflux transporter MFP subunit
MNTGPEKMGEMIFRRVWGMLPALLVVFLAAVILALFVRISGEKKRIEAEKLAALHNARPPVNVVVLEATPMPIRDRLSLPAVVEPWVELSLLAEVPGRVVEVAVKEGEHVRKGDLIARLEARDYENELASVQAEYDLALKNLRRTENLFGEEIVPRARLDDATARVQALEAALKNARLRLQRTGIKAPFPGIVNRLDAEVGLYLNSLDQAALLMDIRKVRVNVGIPESDVDAVRRLTYFDVTFDALEGMTVRGRRVFLSRKPESLAHLYKLEIEVENPRGRILPGMFAKVNVVKREVREGISVPLYAVITRGKGRFVYVESEGNARARMVETGIMEGWKVQVTKGLEKGERVIVVGQRSVEEGQEVNVVRAVADPEELFK